MNGRVQKQSMRATQGVQELPEALAMPVNSCRSCHGQPGLNHLRYWRSTRRHWHVICEHACQRHREDTTMTNTLKKFLADERGATAIEYGLIAAGIALAIISVVNGMGSKLNAKFGSISSSLR
ncbi:putative Flp/Fap pilin component [Bradyrhizobium japonicum SEMIA 5079]|nr:putative Flp/Fap pilin component [Bradyrhizobium japonicum SEMIA 5079]